VLLADIELDHIEKTLKSTFWKISGPFGLDTFLLSQSWLKLW